MYILDGTAVGAREKNCVWIERGIEKTMPVLCEMSQADKHCLQCYFDKDELMKTILKYFIMISASMHTCCSCTINLNFFLSFQMLFLCGFQSDHPDSTPTCSSPDCCELCLYTALFADKITETSTEATSSESH